MELVSLCHHGADVLRGWLPLLLPQLCFGSADRCPKPSLTLSSPTPMWFKAGSPHSTPPCIHGRQLVYSWIFPPTFEDIKPIPPAMVFPCDSCTALLIQAAGSYIISIICFHSASKEFSLTTSSPNRCAGTASSPYPEICVPCC